MMGLSSDHRYRVIDIEAAGISDAAQYLEPFEAPTNYKDSDKIAAYVAEAERIALTKCALDPDLARVVAIGIADTTTGAIVTYLATNEAEERDALRMLWGDIHTQTTIVGYNVIGYDLPVLLRRSLYLNVKAPAIQIDKYRHPTVVDLMQVLSYNGALKYRGLSFYLKRFGIEHDDAVTGADIQKLVDAGFWAAIEAHVRSDVEATVALAKRLGVVQAEAVI